MTRSSTAVVGLCMQWPESIGLVASEFGIIVIHRLDATGLHDAAPYVRTVFSFASSASLAIVSAAGSHAQRFCFCVFSNGHRKLMFS